MSLQSTYPMETSFFLPPLSLLVSPETPKPGTFAQRPLFFPAQVVSISLNQSGITWGRGKVYTTKAVICEDLLKGQPDLGGQSIAFEYLAAADLPLQGESLSRKGPGR